MQPAALIEASAPTRICDLGGWTDTWFAGHGRVLNLAVSPRIHVRVTTHPIADVDHQIVVHADDHADRYGFALTDAPPGRHPLLEAAIAEVGLPDGVAAEVRIHSRVPAGASTGTSAAVVVALVSALSAVWGRRPEPTEAARTAHRVEAERLGLQSGVQDQLAAAHGGISFIEMTKYPDASVTPVPVAPDVWDELDRRLLLVLLGRAHVSSEVHERVIQRLRVDGFDSPDLAALRTMADRGRRALEHGDLRALGAVMRENTDLQAGLHPELVSEDARAVIDVARTNGATGWKVNGAGGAGGSLTVLCGADRESRASLEAQVTGIDRRVRVLPIRLSASGVEVRVLPPGGATTRRE